MSLGKQAFVGFIWTYTQQFSTQLINFFVTLILARLLVPQDFGTIGLLFVFISLGTVIIDGGLGFSLIREKNISSNDCNTVFSTNVFVSFLLYVLLFFLAPFIEKFYNIPGLATISRVYCIIILISSFSSVHNVLLTKELQFKKQMMIALPSLVLSAIVGVTLAFFGYGIWSLVWSGLVKVLLNTLQLWWRSPLKLRFEFDRLVFRKHFSFGFRIMIISLLDTLFVNIYPILIGKFFSVRAVGLFTQAENLKQLPVSNITGAVSKVTFPLFSKIQDDTQKLQKVYVQITEIILCILTPILLFMVVLAKPLIIILFTEKWIDAAPILSILCIAALLPVVNNYNVNLLKVRGKSKLLLRIEILNKTLIVLSICFLYKFGIYGLIWAKVISSIFNFLVNSYYCGKEIRLSVIRQLASVFKCLFIGALAGIVVYFVYTYLEVLSRSIYLNFILAIVIGTLIYLLLIYIFKKKLIFDVRFLFSELLNKKL